MTATATDLADNTSSAAPLSVVGFVGEEVFSYTISDGALSATATVTVDVEAGPPPTLIAVDDTATTQQGQSVTLDVTANDTGLDPLTVIAVSTVIAPTDGAATITDGGATVMYSPDSGFEGTDSFDYTVQDANGDTATATVTITVENAPPVAVDDDAITESGVSTIVDVLSNDTGDGIEVTSVTGVVGGVASHDDRNVTYTPQPDFVGAGGFDYTITDVDGDTATAHATVTVVAPTPIALDDTATTEAGTAAIIAVLSNDTGVGLSVSVTSPPSNGSAVADAGDTVTYTPSAGFSGTDTFGYTVTDVAAQIATATVTVTVAPRAVDDAATTFVSTPVSIPVLANDLGTSLSISALTQPASGSAAINGASIDYTPSATTGVFGFTYTITDGSGQTGVGNVSVTVDPPPNQNPVAVDDAATTFETLPATVDVLANDSDPDTDPLTITSAGPAANGSVIFTGANITYTPNAGFTGTEMIPYAIEDGRSGSAGATLTVTVNADTTPPTITSTLSAPANANGWHNADVTVTFDCQDGESGIASCTDPVTVSSEGADQQVTGDAVDNAGNTASTTVTVSLDKTAPSVSLSGPLTGRRGQTLTVTAAASDNLSAVEVVIAVDGVDVATLTDAPFETSVSIPSDAVVGSFVQVTATATDLAGNTASTTPLSVEVLGGGFLSGEVYDDTRGLPLAGVSITVNGQPTTSGPLGSFGVFTNDSVVEVVASQTGFTTVERVAMVDSISGTVVLDARLTPVDGAVTTIGAGGGTATNTGGNVTVTVPPSVLAADVDVRLTAVSGLGLKNVLPLGWSPVSSVDMEPAGTSILGSTLQLDGDDLTGLSLVLVRYDETSNSWTVEAEGLTGDTFVTATIDETGAYALLVADTGVTFPPPAVVGETLLGVEPVEVLFGLSATSEVIPAVAPVAEDAMATGSVVLFSPLVLPSGTVVSATVQETLESFTEGSLISEPLTQELPLYRFPLRTDDELHQEFPVEPSRTLTIQEFREGRINVAIGTAPSFAKGALVGGEGLIVSGDGDAELVAPAGALAETVSASVESRDPLELGIGFEGLTLVAAAEVDLSSASLLSPGTLSVPVSLATSDNLFAARFLFVAGQRKLRLIGEASFANDRISIPIDTGGTYLFFQSSEPLALIQGTVTEGASPANLVMVESSTTPFMDITPGSGFYVVAAKLEETTITARSLVTGNQAVETVTPPDTAPIALDLVLATTGPFVSQVSPPDGAAGVALAPAITVTFSEPIDPNTVTTASLSLTKADTTPVPGRVVVGSGNLSASYLPDDTLEPITGYIINANTAILDTTGNPLLPFTSSFTTLDVSALAFNPSLITVSFPDADGNLSVEAPVGSVEPDASVMIINDTKSIVTSGLANSDGSFVFLIKGAITDVLQIRITDGSGRETVIDKTEYLGSTGEVAIGTKRGRIAVDEFELEVPSGALTNASIFRLTPLAQSDVDALPPSEGFGGIGSAVELDTGGVTLAIGADLSFPVPPAAPTDADFVVVRKIERQGVTMYDIVDQASRKGDLVSTDSEPFPQVLFSGIHILMWAPRTPLGKSPFTAISALARESNFSPVSPEVRPQKGVEIFRLKNEEPGDLVCTTSETGRCIQFVPTSGFASGGLTLVAKDAQGREAEGVVFEAPIISTQFPGLERYEKRAEVLFEFEFTADPPEPSGVTLSFFSVDQDGNETENTSGFVEVGDDLLIRATFLKDVLRAELFVNDVSVPLRNIDGLTKEADFTPSIVGGHTVRVEALDLLTPEDSFSTSRSFLAVAAGGDNNVSVDGPPRIILTNPLDGAEKIQTSVVLQFVFSEPVSGAGPASVQLVSEDGEQIQLELIGSGPDGTGPAEGLPTLSALTISPEGLRLSKRYDLTFTTDILDTDDLEPLELESRSFSFTTIAPEFLGNVDTQKASGVAVLGTRAFVGLNTFPSQVITFDITDPTRPTPLFGSGGEKGAQFGFGGDLFARIVAEEEVDLEQGPRDVVAVLSTILSSGQGVLSLYDVTSSAPPYEQISATTTNNGATPGAYAADVDVNDGFAYVAIGAGGVRILDLAAEVSFFKNTSRNTIQTTLGTRGSAFTSDGNTPKTAVLPQGLRASAVKVGDVAGTPVAFVGSFFATGGVAQFHSVDVPSASVIATVPIEFNDGQQQLSMGVPSAVGFTEVESVPLALVVGQSFLAVVDVSNTSQPQIVSMVSLAGTSARSITLDAAGSTAFVATTESVEVYNISKNSAPVLAGRIEREAGVFRDVVAARGAVASIGVVGEQGFLRVDTLERAIVGGPVADSDLSRVFQLRLVGVSDEDASDATFTLRRIDGEKKIVTPSCAGFKKRRGCPS